MRQVLLATSLCIFSAAGLNAATVEDGHIKHVLLISIDGMHAMDLSNWISAHPTSTLATLSTTGITYSNALTGAGVLSDSFPGLCALITGGGPGSTGLWYDDAYDRALFANGATSPGVETSLTESLEYNFGYVDGGAQHLNGATYVSHYNETDMINPANLPTWNGTTVVWPHQIQRLNTIFEIVKSNGGYTAWCDKHAAYEWVRGPSGQGLNDFYSPEINSWCNADGTVPVPLQPEGMTYAAVSATGYDLTSSETATQGNDSLKVTAILNQINGKTALGGATTPVNSVPTLFGMNFQSVSVSQKLRHDPLWTATAPQGGYTDAVGTPSSVLTSALTYVDAQVGSMVAALKTANLYNSTLIIITAKHGQSPIDVTTLAVEKSPYSQVMPLLADPVNQSDGTMGGTVGFSSADGISEPAAGGPIQTAFAVSDDVYLIWLKNQIQTSAAVSYLNANATAFRIQNIYWGQSLIARFNTNPVSDSRCPDIIIQPIPGTIYNSGKKKISEHGGASHNDLNVCLMMSNATLTPQTITTQVLTTQVAPTILLALSLPASSLDSTMTDGTTDLVGASSTAAATTTGAGGTTVTVPAASSSSSSKCGLGSGEALVFLGLAGFLTLRYRSIRRAK